MKQGASTPRTLVVITGASSGIGLALATGVPYDDAVVVSVSRRGGPVGESVRADLSHPSSWGAVGRCVERHLDRGGVDHAVLMHFAGRGSPHVPAIDADPAEYARSVILNGASGPSLAQAFLSACCRAGVLATAVLCSSPAATVPLPRVSHYGSGKAGMEYWVRSVTAERHAMHPRVFAVIPHAVNTPMVQELLARGEEGGPVAAALRDVAAGPGLAPADRVAQEIWQLVLDGDHDGETIAVGQVPR
jgi:benzil reductase ((S)-benzoin forming)